MRPAGLQLTVHRGSLPCFSLPALLGPRALFEFCCFYCEPLCSQSALCLGVVLFSIFTVVCLHLCAVLGVLLEGNVSGYTSNCSIDPVPMGTALVLITSPVGLFPSADSKGHGHSILLHLHSHFFCFGQVEFPRCLLILSLFSCVCVCMCLCV